MLGILRVETIEKINYIGRRQDEFYTDLFIFACCVHIVALMRQSREQLVNIFAHPRIKLF